MYWDSLARDHALAHTGSIHTAYARYGAATVPSFEGQNNIHTVWLWAGHTDMICGKTSGSQSSGPSPAVRDAILPAPDVVAAKTMVNAPA